MRRLGYRVGTAGHIDYVRERQDTAIHIFTPRRTLLTKFATREYEGERVTLELELKILADASLVCAPNAGKTTLLRALSVGRACSTVAGHAFTTLNLAVDVVRVADDGTVLGGEYGGGHGEREGVVYDETVIEKQR
jgi:GTP-binding protein